MRNDGISLAVSGAYVWIAMVAFGGIAVETVVIYPNVFHDAPASLAKAMEFFVVTGPADLFPPMGAVTVLAAAATLLSLRRAREARWWITGSLGTLLVGEFLFSVLYFWPRNDLMFEEGIAEHSVEFLRRTALEFEVGHWFRLAFSAVTATLAFIGFLRYHRARALSGGSA
ncbi:anthrone oxygenase family protein [Amycolatopsis coloradensis]|uniref:Anthrone oxygenase family protein n=1 Tax=Amycolatopsis coloradensis TaxID=76021 RepID=A0ACD5BDU0_9PSEU